ncbi:MAG: hypothetical protein AAF800_06395 [Planctomycetota bacterium]
MSRLDDAERVAVDSADELRRWLEAHHARTDGVWPATHRAAVPDKYLSAAALDELLCFA